ncbi:MAG: carboxypeptidase regulatory-like domain-containing protein [Deltaproteobacteria bacterium]|nr:carboxypeptidase regulatory-like domain-containing protein [Deltaproteobacteria bacterium]
MFTRNFIILIFVFCLPSISAATVVDGIVLSHNGPVADARVTAYKNAVDMIKGRAAVIARQTKKPGEYHFDLPAGKYFFTARDSKHQFYAYHGRNPIKVHGSRQWLPLFALPARPARCKAGFQGLGGQVIYKGKILRRGSVSVYNTEDVPYRGMGVLTNTIGDNGRFWFNLEPGRYMLFARQRHASSAMGPLKQGDLFCFSAASPITIKPALDCQVDLYCYPRDDIDSFLNAGALDPRAGHERQRRRDSLENTTVAIPGHQAGGRDFAVIAGRITNLANLPVGGLFVSAYSADDQRLFEMYIVRFKSKYMTRSNNQGFFRLELPAGSYYLVARQHMGEAPVSGEYYGLYEGNSNHSIKIGAGEFRTGIQLKVSHIMP